jgi:hypothetical protein
MSGALWSSTAKKPITKYLQDAIKGLKVQISDRSSPPGGWLEEMQKRIERNQAEIARRKADERFLVELKHIGSFEEWHKNDEMRSADESARHAAEVRAREKLVARGGAIQDHDMFSEVIVDQEWLRYKRESATRWLKEGLVNPTETMSRIYSIGGAELLAELVHEVQHWQMVPWDDPQGES